jgi:SAM-dependent methyltransferase
MGYVPEIYWEERLTKKFTLSGAGYSSKSIAFNKWVYRARVRCLERALEKCGIEPLGKRILDIGCGTGFYIDFWQSKKPSFIAGIDITKKSVSELKRKYPQCRFEILDIGEKRLFDVEKFDLISVFDVLFHIVDEKRFENAIYNMKQCSHPGTCVLITDTLGKVSVSRANYVRIRSLTRYLELFNANRFEILGIFPQFFLLNPPSGIKNKYVRIFLHNLWRVFTLPSKSKFFGKLQGSLLYYIDVKFQEICSDGPATKLIVVRSLM